MNELEYTVPRFYSLTSVQILKLPYDFAENGDLTVMEGVTHVPFAIARVFVVRGFEGSVRGEHAHKACTQFLTCPYGVVEVRCDDGSGVATYILDKPDVGLLLPPSIWAQQTYLQANSVLTVLCDRPYEKLDYLRNYEEFKKYRSICNEI
jgi:dTDP-4-dehydrorhamnose 3,5-epimerase-like enzyme